MKEKFVFRIRTIRRPTLMLVIAISAATLPLVSYAMFGSAAAENSEPARVQVSTQEPTTAVADNIEIEMITLRPEGFEPSQITRSKGPFVLLVDDRSGAQVSSLKLQRTNGEQLHDISTGKNKSEWYDVMDLPPGDYLVSDPANPQKRCQITIQP